MEVDNKKDLEDVRLTELVVVFDYMIRGIKKFWKQLLLVLLLSVLGGLAVIALRGRSVLGEANNATSYGLVFVWSLCIGIFLCGAILAFYGFARFTAVREGDVAFYFHIPAFGCVRIFRKNEKKVPVALLKDDKTFMESFRTVRNNVMRLAEEDDKKCFVVTSVKPNEGTTTVAVNLALSLAKKQKCVALIDANFRNPSVANVLNLSTDGPEVGSVLSNGSFHGRDFQRCKDLDLFVLCGRPTSGDKPAVLDLTAVYTYLQELKEACDYIIIDTSACGAFADALQMGSCSDGVILNVQQDNSSLYQIRYVLEQLAGVGASVDGYVMNQYQRGVVDLV